MSDHLNPGTVDPASQSFPAADLSRAASEPGSASVTTSTGETQVPGRRAMAAEPVAGAGLASSSSGESQFRNDVPASAATTSHRGLAANVAAGDASQARPPESTRTERLPPLAAQVDGCSGRPGGLPVNVMIR